MESSARFDIHFEDPRHATLVVAMMSSERLSFQQTIDQLELRPNVHFHVVRVDQGDDGRG